MTFPLITKAYVEIFTTPKQDDEGNIFEVPDGAMVFLEVEGNGIYVRNVSAGETLDQVTAAYKPGFRIDETCVFFGAAMTEEENEAFQLQCLEEDAAWHSKRCR